MSFIKLTQGKSADNGETILFNTATIGAIYTHDDRVYVHPISADEPTEIQESLEQVMSLLGLPQKPKSRRINGGLGK